MAYSLDFRERALALVDEGRSYSDVSRLMGVQRKTVSEWKQRRDQGQLAVSYPKRRGAYKINETALKAELKKRPDAYLAELASVAGGSEQGIRHAMKRLNITRKKRPRTTKKETKVNAKPT